MINSTHPSQVFKYCPRCGHQGFAFDGIKAFNCSVCHFRFYINACGAVAVILELPDGKIILTRRKYEPKMGFFDLPGGFVDANERVEDTVRREVMEELGISIQSLRYLTSFPNQYIYKGITYFTLDLAFVCPTNDLSGMKPSDDVAEALSIYPSEIDYSTISFPSIVNILTEYIEDGSGLGRRDVGE